MARKYHTLLVRHTPWGIEFGSYDRSDVEGEQEEMGSRPKGTWGYTPKKDTKIITTGDKQADIQAAVDKLNAGIKGSK